MPKKKSNLPEIREYIKNRSMREKMCEQILGSQGIVSDFAIFYKNQKQNLKILEAALLVDYCKNGTFTPQEYSNYREGIRYVIKFFDECFNEIKLSDENNNNKKDLTL